MSTVENQDWLFLGRIIEQIDTNVAFHVSCSGKFNQGQVLNTLLQIIFFLNLQRSF
jgi:hypothetical protein